jgi:hypothetical protein
MTIKKNLLDDASEKLPAAQIEQLVEAVEPELALYLPLEQLAQALKCSWLNRNRNKLLFFFLPIKIKEIAIEL